MTVSSAVQFFDLRVHSQSERASLLSAVDRVLQHGQFVLGPEVGEFERRMSVRLGVPHVLGVASGTDALRLGLQLADVGPGDEVLMPSHTFFATATAAMQLGAVPVFVDIDLETMLLCPEALQRAITPRSRAVIAVHLGGFPCPMDRISGVCSDHRLALLEDCAQSVGASFNGRATGSFGIGAFSLHPLKVLSAVGDGGLLAFTDEGLRSRALQLRNLGMRDRDHCDEVSGHSRLDTIQAAMLLAKLEQLDEQLADRRARAARYDAALARLRPQRAIPGGLASYSTYVVRVPERARVVEALREVGIDTKVHYPIPAHRQRAFAHLSRGALPATDTLVAEMLSLPIGRHVDEAAQQRVIDELLRLCPS